MNPIEFGEKTRQDHYLIDQDVVYVNHGSYGPCPRLIYEELRRIRFEQERNPDQWMRLSKHNLYVDCVRAAARRLDCNFEQITIVDNATIGFNAILKSPLPTFTSAPGGTILCTSLAYGAVLFAIEETARQRGMKMQKINIQFPIESKQAFIQQFEHELNKDDAKNIRLAVIDHITSTTAILLPIDELTALLHRYGIPVLIDGAHAPGQVKPYLSLNKLTCDFYVGTFHKWMYAARGCSFLFVRDPVIARQIQPANTSWGYHPFSFQLETLTHFHLQFFHQGTRDECALLTLTKAIDFVDRLAGGCDRIYHYNSTLSEQAKTLLEQRWNTQGRDLAPNDMHAPYLKMIQLPDLKNYEKTDIEGYRLLADLMKYHKLVSIILCVNNELYVRIAAQIYNRIEDYLYLADIVDQLKK